ncbi:MAG: four helix bundle protein [Flavobacteriales bacterium]|nr:four helix bundle protein [Flavobacteriales bacterium]
MPQPPIRSFTELLAWQKAREVRKAISVLVKGWPAEEKFRLGSGHSFEQGAANIAEGFGRFHEKDNARFCRMAKSSMYETMDHLTAAFDEGYMDRDAIKSHWALIEESIKVINGYVRYLNGLSGTSVADPPAIYGEQDIRPPPKQETIWSLTTNNYQLTTITWPS